MDEEREEGINPPNDEMGEEFRIEFTESKDYTVRAASSVRGGVQMRGDFLFEFFTERYEDPEAAVYSVTEEGRVGDHIRNESFDSALIREKQVGVMMSQANAFDTGTWIIANLLGDGVTQSDIENVIVSEFEDKIETGDSE